ncbi:hypothetical protein [Bacteroides cellulosilyticus]|uniref:hypothetical protein n=1 Tax=Bacteroides cellulosilyticus TaxID=246787 RepID=UPI002F964731
MPNPWLLSDAIISLSLMVSLLMMIPDEPAKTTLKERSVETGNVVTVAVDT